MTVFIILTGCGGGGGSSGSNPTVPIPNIDGNTNRPDIGNNFTNIQKISTSILGTNEFYNKNNNGPQNCIDDTCTITTTNQQTSISEIDFSHLKYNTIMTRRGIKMARGTGSFNGVGQFPDEKYINTQTKYGGWMNHGYFWVVHNNIDAIDPVFFREYESVIGYAIGELSGTVPSTGSATYNGAMLGVDRGEDLGTLVNIKWLQGDAVFTVDFQNSNMDAEFNNIRNLTDGTDYSIDTIAFDDIPFTSDGFASGSSPNRISGKFYGSDHEEVGGIFEHGDVTGSFGGIRQ